MSSTDNVQSSESIIPEDWVKKYKLFEDTALLAPLLSPEVIHQLVTGNSVSLNQNHAGFMVFPLDDYLGTVTAVGQKHPPGRFGTPARLLPGHSMISIRGSPRLSLLAHLGMRIGLEPADIFDHASIPDSFRVSGLPQYPKPVLTFRMVSFGRWYRAHSRVGQRHLDLSTEQFARRDTIGDQREGSEQFRHINLHAADFISVEQNVSFLVYSREQDDNSRGWSGILLNDSGEQSTAVPWASLKTRDHPAFFPLVRSGRCTVSTDLSWHPPHNTQDSGSYSSPDPCESRARHDSRCFMNAQVKGLACQDPLVVVFDLLTTSALSWSRCFDFLHALHHNRGHDDVEDRVAFLLRDRQVLHNARAYFSDMLSFLRRREQLTWPHAATQQDRVRVDEMIESAVETLVHLDQRADDLSRMCAESIAVEMNVISITEARKGLAQASRIELLTVLAFLFIPMSFVSSFFGMNVQTFKDPGPPLVTFFQVAIPITLPRLEV
ncbi:unnamed protein product, partial [Clonostachys solani]